MSEVSTSMVARMKNNITAIALLCLGIAISGCTSMGTSALKDQTTFVGFKVGATTRNDVYQKLGQPHDVTTFLGRNGWRYISADTNPEPGMFVLGVIFWPLALAGQNQYDVTQVDFFFDTEGKLLDSVVRKAQISKGISSVTDALSDQQKQVIDRIKAEMSQIDRRFDEDAAKKSLAYLAI